MSLTKLPLGRNYSVMTSLFSPRESLVVTSRLGTGNTRSFFYGVEAAGLKIYSGKVVRFSSELVDGAWISAVPKKESAASWEDPGSVTDKLEDVPRSRAPRAISRRACTISCQSSNGNASEMKANESFDNGVFFDIEAKRTPSIVNKLFLKRSEHISLNKNYFRSEANTFDSKTTVFKTKTKMSDSKKIIFEAKRTH